MLQVASLTLKRRIPRLPSSSSLLVPMLPLRSAIAATRLRSVLAAESPRWGLVPQGRILLMNDCYIHKQTFTSKASSSSSYIQDMLGNCCAWVGRSPYVLKNLQLQASTPYKRLFLKGFAISFRESIQGLSVSEPELEHISLPDADGASDDNMSARDVMTIQNILISHGNDTDLSSALDECTIQLNEDLVVLVLQRHRSDWKLALSFFNWATRQSNYLHGSRAYGEMLDILGRMKQIRLMRQVFDEIPKDRHAYVINDRTFAILMNRYAGAHKVQEAIDIFYKRMDYGFKLDMSSFQILLTSLCRYKHVEEAETLFLQKQDEFPPVIKSRNIILNGWCVLGNLHEAKRFWNNILSSDCKPDLFTYSIFINSLTKAGKLSAALKLFTSMGKKGCIPDVTIYNCIIDALCFKKKIPQALEIFSEMDESGCPPNAASYNSLIKHLCKIKRMQKVHELLDEMEQKGCVPNAITYSYILKKMEGPEEVTALMLRMKRTGCGVDADNCNLILKMYLHWNYERGIKSIWDEMKRNGLGPDQRSYIVMVHGLHKQGMFDEALQFYNEMRAKGMTPEPRTEMLVKEIYLKREDIPSSNSLKRGVIGANSNTSPQIICERLR